MTDLRNSETKPDDNRIFPMVYTGVIIRQGDQNILTPMRYFCRPAGRPAFYDKKFPGLYNARRDNLERFWSEQFGHHHAIMVAESFYENVRLHTMEHRVLAPGEEDEMWFCNSRRTGADHAHRLPVVAVDRSEGTGSSRLRSNHR